MDHSSEMSPPDVPRIPEPVQSKCLATVSGTVRQNAKWSMCCSLQRPPEDSNEITESATGAERITTRKLSASGSSLTGTLTAFQVLRWSLGFLTDTLASYWKLPCQIPTPATDTCEPCLDTPSPAPQAAGQSHHQHALLHP